jgi:hypothetical protein
VVSIANAFLDPEHMFFFEVAWFTLNRNVKSQNNRYWCSENPHAVHAVPLA